MGNVYFQHEATDSLEFQVEELIDGSAVSLSAMWRASGEPAGREPEAWAELASPLIEGMRAYHLRLDAADPDEARRDQGDPAPVWVNEHLVGDRDLDEFHRPGDLMTTQTVAQYYAIYLDSRAARDAGCIGYA